MKRTGGRNDACFRLVAADERSPRDGRNLEILGWYDPAAKGQTFSLKLDRVDYWLGVGAKITDTAASLVKKARNGDNGIQEEPVAAGEAAPEPTESTEAAVEETSVPAEEPEPIATEEPVAEEEKTDA